MKQQPPAYFYVRRFLPLCQKLILCKCKHERRKPGQVAAAAAAAALSLRRPVDVRAVTVVSWG